MKSERTNTKEDYVQKIEFCIWFKNKYPEEFKVKWKTFQEWNKVN